MDDYDENRMFTEEEWEAATPYKIQSQNKVLL